MHLFSQKYERVYTSPCSRPPSFFLFFCQPKKCVALSSSARFYSCNLVCSSCSGPVMERPPVSLPAWGGLLSAIVDRKLELSQGLYPIAWADSSYM